MNGNASWRRALPLVLILAGCWDDEAEKGGGGASLFEARPEGVGCRVAVAEPGASRAGETFEPGHVLCVELEMAPSALDRMVVETRFGPTVDEFDAVAASFAEAAEDCDGPWPDAYTTYGADVRIDGVRLTNVGVHKRGFLGSVFSPSPSLKIKTDAFVDGQALPDGTEHIVLNNNASDPTRLATCLAYRVFAAAGYPAPMCQPANVVANGRPFGPYAHVEAVKKRFLRRVFGDDQGSLYEGTITDFQGEGRLRWETITDETDETRAPIQALTDALDLPDGQLLEALAARLNIDRFVRFWALEVLLNLRDGYTSNQNNVYVYFDPSDDDRAVLVPWGPDLAFSDALDGRDPRLDDFAVGAIARRLAWHPQTAGRLEAELERLLAEVWDEDALLAEVTAGSALVRQAERNVDYDAAVERLRSWIRGRRAQVEDMLVAGFAASPGAPRRCAPSGAPEP